MKRFWVFWTLAAAAWAQSHGAMEQQGGFWVQTVTGSLEMAPGSALEVDTAGGVVLRGGPQEQVFYTLRKRVRAATESEARRMLDAVSLKAWTAAGVARLQVQCPKRQPPLVDLELAVPASLRRAALRTQWGNIDAAGIEGRVEAVTAAGMVKADRIGKGLAARSGGGNVEIGTVDGPVHAFSSGGAVRIGKAGGETRVETGGGDVAVREIGGALFAATAGGNISAGTVGGGVTAQTAGGSIEIGRAGGPVVAQTSGGAIVVGSARDVRCESSAGAIRLRGVSGALRANTALGSIVAELAAARLADSILSTSSGDVTVWIPSNIAVTVRAQNESGGRLAKIISDFPEINIRPAAIHMSVGEGAINGGGPVLTVSTSNGVIYLRRQK